MQMYADEQWKITQGCQNISMEKGVLRISKILLIFLNQKHFY
jgi:hypothetical protein